MTSIGFGLYSRSIARHGVSVRFEIIRVGVGGRSDNSIEWYALRYLEGPSVLHNVRVNTINAVHIAVVALGPDEESTQALFDCHVGKTYVIGDMAVAEEKSFYAKIHGNAAEENVRVEVDAGRALGRRAFAVGVPLPAPLRTPFVY